MLKDNLKDNIVFLKGFVSEFKSTGAFCRTSKPACRAMTKPLRGDRKPMSILEIGAGTGAVTSQILANFREGDSLTICEINPRFIRELKSRLERDPRYQRFQDNIDFFEGAIQDIGVDKKYDLLVCSLPFLNFEVKTVEEIFAKLREISKEDTIMTYYQFMGLRKLGKIISPPKRKKRLHEIETYFLTEHNSHMISSKRVWLNLLPINVYTLEMAA